MKNPLLVAPSKKYEKSYREALEEVKHDANQNDTKLMSPKEGESFRNFVDRLLKNAKGIDVPQDWTPSTTLWLMDDDEFIGRFSIRHELTTEKLKTLHGHIGYYIRPSKRRRGYGKKILELGLKEAKKLGITDALITCDVGNVGSQKIIEANGGVFENKVSLKDEKDKLRFWIRT